uniref:DUF4283 domain-containing protein n=1 Tax=Elaeophora elaphi TaxID=1147741 RepID=A0A0R3RP69_9BILA
LRRNWIFSLVNKEIFNIGKFKCAVNVETLGIGYLHMNTQVAKKLKSWTTVLDGHDDQETRICLGHNVCYVKATS